MGDRSLLDQTDNKIKDDTSVFTYRWHLKDISYLCMKVHVDASFKCLMSRNANSNNEFTSDPSDMPVIAFEVYVRPEKIF